jgi:hypothetical protein
MECPTTLILAPPARVGAGNGRHRIHQHLPHQQIAANEPMRQLGGWQPAVSGFAYRMIGGAIARRRSLLACATRSRSRPARAPYAAPRERPTEGLHGIAGEPGDSVFPIVH